MYTSIVKAIMCRVYENILVRDVFLDKLYKL
jgi:hypothetical protein